MWTIVSHNLGRRSLHDVTRLRSLRRLSCMPTLCKFLHWYNNMTTIPLQSRYLGLCLTFSGHRASYYGQNMLSHRKTSLNGKWLIFCGLVKTSFWLWQLYHYKRKGECMNYFLSLQNEEIIRQGITQQTCGLVKTNFWLWQLYNAIMTDLFLSVNGANVGQRNT